MIPMVNWGILGASQVAKRRCLAIEQAPNAAVVAVSSGKLAKAQHFVRDLRLGRCMAYGSYNDMLKDDDVHVVYIAVPTVEKKKWALKAIELRKHVLVETPVAWTSCDLEEIIQRARAYQVQFMSGCVFPHNERTLELSDELRDVEFGELQSIHCHHSIPARCLTEFVNNDIRMSPGLEPAGVLGSLGWPCFSFAVMMFGLRTGAEQHPTEVMCKVLSVVRGACTKATGIISFSGGGSCTFNISFDSTYLQQASLIGTARSIHMDDFVYPRSDSVSTYERVDDTLSLGDERVCISSQKSVHTQCSQEVSMINDFSALVLDLESAGFPSDPEHVKWAILAAETQRVLDAACESAGKGGSPTEIKR